MSRLEALTKVLAEVRNGANRFIRFSPLFKNFIITDGVHDAMTAAESFWLLDILATELAPKVNNDISCGNVALVTLHVRQPETGACVIEASTYEEPSYWRKEIPFSTFPKGNWTLFNIGGAHWNEETGKPGALVCSLLTED